MQDTVEYAQDEREIMYTTTPKKQRPALSSVNVSMIGVMGWMRCFAFIFNFTAPLFPKFPALEILIFSALIYNLVFNYFLALIC